MNGLHNSVKTSCILQEVFEYRLIRLARADTPYRSPVSPTVAAVVEY